MLKMQLGFPCIVLILLSNFKSCDMKSQIFGFSTVIYSTRSTRVQKYCRQDNFSTEDISNV